MPVPLHYVVLHHQGIENPHYDLLFEWGLPNRPTLGSLRCSDWPPTASTQCERIRDHRPFYLTYEGPITNGRGFANRVAGGTCTIEAAGLEDFVLTLDNRLRVVVPRAPFDK